jgi:SAM-dependent methyltransferase
VVDRETRRLSFGSVAADYDRYRPSPPPQALDWIIPPDASAILDLAAGTGVVTRKLVGRAARVYAVEPDERMRAVLAARCPGAEVLDGRGEDIPLSDQRYNTDADFDVVDRLTEVAAERGAPPAQVALAWLLSRPGVTAPIIGATKLGHITDALAASQLTLSGEEVRRLEEPYIPHPVLGHG